MTVVPGSGWSLDDQRWFADLSGDTNPLHVDPVAARRLLFGAPAVHGVHQVLVALDHLADAGVLGLPSRLRVDFLGPVRIDEPAELRWWESGDRVTVEVRSDGVTATRVRVDRGGDRPADGPVVDDPRPEHPPVDLHSDPDDRPTGTLRPALDVPAAGHRFGALLATWGPRAVAELCATTRLVGTICPGEDSLFVGLDLRRGTEGADAVEWSLRRHSAALRMVDLRVDGAAFSGSVRAMVRPRPHRQPTTAELLDPARASLHRGRRVLVVGGSRGLGEVAAKLWATAGAEVVLTHVLGAADAEEVTDDIRRAGGAATALRLDVTGDVAGALDRLDGPVTDVAHFAAPRLELSPDTPFSARAWRSMSEVLVVGLGRVVTTLRERHPERPLRVWHPSTAFLDVHEPGAAEYVAAKAAAERLLTELAADDEGLEVRSARLPRMATDQTQAMIEIEREDPVAVLRRWIDADAPSSAVPEEDP